MSNHRTRRQTTQLKNHTDAPSSAAVATLKEPPEALLVPDKPDVLEHYKVEDRIHADEVPTLKVSDGMEGAAEAENIDGASQTEDGQSLAIQSCEKEQHNKDDEENLEKFTDAVAVSTENTGGESTKSLEDTGPRKETSAKEHKNETSDQVVSG